jgi:hypothetical protein
MLPASFYFYGFSRPGVWQSILFDVVAFLAQTAAITTRVGSSKWDLLRDEMDLIGGSTAIDFIVFSTDFPTHDTCRKHAIMPDAPIWGTL